MTGRLAVLGAGGHGCVAADCAEAAGWQDIQLFDDRLTQANNAAPWPVAGTIDDVLAASCDFDGVVVGIGSNTQRLALALRLVAAGAPLVTLIHPSAVISRRSTIGRGSLICAGAVVSVGATLGEAVIVNTSATVDHDCVLGDGVHVAPGAHLAGGVAVGAETWIGIGSTVREYVTIGNRVFIGAGAVVVKSIPDGMKVVGNPARPING